MSFILAIVGRPNVGKSTLFNRLVGKRLALVDDQPGVTRDLREGKAQLGPLKFTVIDTAGLEEATDESLQGRMRKLTERAVEMADACLFMIDARAGVLPGRSELGDGGVNAAYWNATYEGGPRNGVLTALALLSTFAGNLLLTGSLCNIIVAERAAASGAKLGFGDFARSGIPMTLLSMAAAVLWLWFMGVMRV